MAYRHLLELAEDGDINRLVNGFIEKEEKNFACFCYATELNNEMEKMQWRIKDLQVCSRLFMSPLSQLVLLGWGGLFPLPCVQHHCPHQCPAHSLPHGWD